VQKFICSQHESQNAFEFAPFASVGVLAPMNSSSQNPANPWIVKAQQLFNRDLPLENDCLRQENKILRSKFGARATLSESDRRVLVKYGLRIKDRLAESCQSPSLTRCWPGIIGRNRGWPSQRNLAH
jgi:hypothetical protein